MKTLTLNEVVEQHGQFIYNIARKVLKHPEDAEDALQEVYKVCILKMHTFKGDSALRTWLYRVAFNKALEIRQRRAKIQQQECLCDDNVANTVIDVPVDKDMLVEEEKVVIASAIRKLPPDFKQVLLMSHFEDMSNAQIGERLNLSVPAVKSRLHRARKGMRKLLAGYCL